MSDQSDLYGFVDSLDPARLRSQIRMLQANAPVLRAGDNVFSDSQYTAVNTNAVDSTGQINLLAKSGLVVAGAMPPNVIKGNFGYTSTASSIHWYWDGTNSSAILVIKRADGTSMTVPSGDLNITGLAGATKYYFYPYWNVAGGCGVSWVIGTIGAPQVAFSAIDAGGLSAQTQLGHEQLSGGAMTASTGSSGGAGGGGGAGFCVMRGTIIEPLVESWEMTEVMHQETDWIRLDSGNGTPLICTRDHPLITPDGRKREAHQFDRGDWVVCKDRDRKILEWEPIKRACAKVEVKMEHGHMFWANGFLSHNMKQFET